MEQLHTSFVLNSARFFENYINVTHAIMGYEMQPFCLLHLLWMENIDSPFFHTSENFTLSDLEIAVLICSSKTSEEILSKLNCRGRIKTICKRFWHSKNKRRKLGGEVVKFLKYQEDFSSLPAYASGSGGERVESLPSFFVQAAALIEKTGWSQEYVFLMPLGQLIWFNAAFSYLATGKTSVISDKETAIRFAMRQQLTGARA